MPLTIEQQKLKDDVERDRLLETNALVRDQLASGVSVGDIAGQYAPGNNIDPREVLAAMSVAETHQMKPGEAYSMLPVLLTNIYGKQFNLDNVVKDFYTQSKEFELPYKPLTQEQVNTQILEEEQVAPLFRKEIGPLQAGRDIPVPLMGGFNQAYSISAGLRRSVVRQKWFDGDPSKEEFFNSILDADTDEEKEEARSNRFSALIADEQQRVQRLKDWEKRIEKLKTDPPGIWTSKVNAWTVGVGRIRQASYDVSGEIVKILGEATDSSSMQATAQGLHDMARAYHKATQSPDLMVLGVNQLDEMTNSFLQTAPYIGAAATAAFFSPDKLTPFAIFFIAAGVEGSAIRQTALDNDFSEKSARFRAWLGGTTIGLIEASGGGVTKFNPKNFIGRLRDYPGKLGKVALKEIFREELPQETVAMLVAGDIPYTDKGEIDWDEVVNRFMIIARDTAFTSAIIGSGSSVIGEVQQWNRKNLLSKEMSQSFKDAVDFTIAQKQAEDAQIETLAKELEKSLNLTPERALRVAKKKLAFDAKQAAEVAEKPPEAPPEAEGAVVEPKLTPEEELKAIEATKEDDEVKVETVPEAENISELIDESPVFGVMEQPDGKYAVLDWNTQQEVMVDLDKDRAEREMAALNSGQSEIAKKRVRTELPTSQDIETLTHTQLLRNTFKSVSRHARKAVAQTTRDIIRTHRNLAMQARLSLEGMHITEGQRNSLARKIASAKKDSDIRSLVATIEAIREISLHKKYTAEFNKIRRYVNKAARRRLSDGGIHYKVYESLQSLLDNYTALSPKILNSVKRTKKFLDDMRETVADQSNVKYAEALIPKATMNKIDELVRTPITDLAAEELNQLNQSLKHYLSLNQTYTKLIMNRKVQEARDFLNGAVATVKLPIKPAKGKRFKPQRGIFRSMLDAFTGIANDDMYTIATKIWGKFDPISNMVMTGRRNQLGLTKKYTELLRGILDEHNITIDQLIKWSPNMHLILSGQRAKVLVGRGVDLHTIKIGGVDHQFTMAELMAFSLHSKNNYNRRRIVRNGVATKDESVGKLSKEEFQQMHDIINNDPAARAFVDSLERFYKEQANDINKTSRKLDGLDIASVDNYFHVEYEGEGGVIGTEYVRDAIIDEEGRLKPRTSSNRPVLLRDVFEVISEDIRVISEFAGMTETIRMLRSLVNYTPFRERIKRDANAKHIMDRMDEELRSMQLSRQPAIKGIERAARKIEAGVAQAVLLNPRIWALQPFSAALYAIKTSFRYMRAIRVRLGEQFNKDLMNNWTLYWSRVEGIGAAKSVTSPSTIRRVFTGQGNLRDRAMVGLHKADQWGVSRAAQVTMAEMTDPQLYGRSLEWWQNYGTEPTSLEYDTEQFWKAFNDRADYLVTLTQPMFFPESKSSYSNSNNPLVRTLARFRSFIDQIGRIIRRQMVMRRYDEVSRAEAVRNIGIAVASVSVVAAVIRHLFDLIAGKEKDKDDLLRETVTSPLAVIPFLGYPAKRIADAMLGGEGAAPEFSAMPIMMIDNILRHSWQIAKGLNYAFDDEFIQSGPNRGEKKSTQFLKDGIQGTVSDYLTLRGIPVRTIEQIEWWKE